MKLNLYSCFLPKYSHLFCLAVFLLASCKGSVREADPAFGKYIESYTTGTISKQSPIRIRLSAETTALHAEGAPVAEKLFSFDPRIEGQAFWLDSRTIEFRPEKNLEPGRMYQGVFRLSRVNKVPDEFKDFDFRFRVIPPSFELEEQGLKVKGGTSPEYLELNGYITTADVEDPVQVEKILSLEYEGGRPALRWQHAAEAKKHHFFIDSIRRGEGERDLL
ncbi:MAG TPA: hypothetical protein VD772_05085, partial [Anseongella sp.]|nr:hypothetical protein [Anseongella sp.]